MTLDRYELAALAKMFVLIVAFGSSIAALGWFMSWWTTRHVPYWRPW